MLIAILTYSIKNDSDNKIRRTFIAFLEGLGLEKIDDQSTYGKISNKGESLEKVKELVKQYCKNSFRKDDVAYLFTPISDKKPSALHCEKLFPL